MPSIQYKLFHSNACLSSSERQQLATASPRSTPATHPREPSTGEAEPGTVIRAASRDRHGDPLPGSLGLVAFILHKPRDRQHPRLKTPPSKPPGQTASCTDHHHRLNRRGRDRVRSRARPVRAQRPVGRTTTPASRIRVAALSASLESAPDSQSSVPCRARRPAAADLVVGLCGRRVVLRVVSLARRVLPASALVVDRPC